MDDQRALLKYQELTGKIIEIFYQVYNETGFGFLESVHQNSMLIALREAGLHVEAQHPITVYFRGQIVGSFFADLIVENLVILELKTARAIAPAFEAQAINYLRGTEFEVALLLNFGPKPEVKRLVFDNTRKRHGTARPPPS